MHTRISPSQIMKYELAISLSLVPNLTLLLLQLVFFPLQGTLHR